MKQISNLVIRNNKYYWRQTINGQNYLESLGLKADETKATRAKAAQMIKIKQRAVETQNWEDLYKTRQKSPFCDIGHVLEHFRMYAAASGMRPDTAAGYQGGLRVILRAARGIQHIESASTAELTANLIHDYETAAIKEVDVNDPVALKRRRNTIHSTVRQARALFSRRAMMRYKHLTLPDLEGFLTAGCVSPDHSWTPPPPDLVAATKAKAQHLQITRPDLYTVWLLAYGLGMRAAEIANARWSWIEEINGAPAMNIIARPDEWSGPKGAPGHVPMGEKLTAWLMHTKRPDDIYILKGESYWQRYDFVTREFADWMRDLGWLGTRYTHCAHELRRLRGSEWWSDPSIGPAVCSAWLRHKSITVTQAHYGKLLTHPAPLDID